MTQQFEVAVLGLGGFGSACLYHLALRGIPVVGLDQFPRAHRFGSSHGQTRIIRQAYFEHPDYVPLLKTAYSLWHDLEAASGQSLSRWTGLMLCGPAEGQAIHGARLSAERYGIPIENLGQSDAARRFPGFRIPHDFDAVFEPGAGILFPEACVSAHLALAERNGAQVQTESRVLDWSENDSGIEIRTESGTISAKQLIVTSGAWGIHRLRQPHLQILRKSQIWFGTAASSYRADAGCPAYFFELPEGEFYGFPSLDGKTLKVAEHSGGEPLNNPSTLDRTLLAHDWPRLSEFIRQHLPDVSPRVERHSICMYTMSPDGHFIVDRHPDFSRVVIGLGFSGHGFKFCSVIGQALTDLAVDGETNHPIDFLRLHRFAQDMTGSTDVPSVEPA